MKNQATASRSRRVFKASWQSVGRRTARLGLAIAMLGAAAACGSESEGVGSAHSGAADEQLSPEEINNYLLGAGYLPNQTLQERYPGWRPLVDLPLHNTSVIEDATREGVKALQARNGLPVTGTVDGATGAAMRGRACGVPESAAAPSHANGEKYARGARYTKTGLTYRVMGSNLPAGMTLAYFESQVQLALMSISGMTKLTFDKRDELAQDTDLTFAFDIPQVVDVWNTSTTPWTIISNVDGRHQPNVGQTLGGRLWFDNSVPTTSWTNQSFLYRLALHETGHAVGLAHSSIPACPGGFAKCAGPSTPLMNENLGPALTQDDVTAFAVSYPRFQIVGGCAQDVASASGHTWIIGCNAAGGGSYRIWKFSAGSWVQVPSPHAGKRIAVDPTTGVPWVLAGDGSIWKGNSTNPATIGFTQVPGCADDIDIKNDGRPWVIGCGGGISELLASGAWRQVPGAATEIAVDRLDAPWVVNSGHLIYQWSVLNGSFTNLAGAALDVSVNNEGSAWIVGTDNAVWSFSDQPKADGINNNGAPFRAQWEQAPGVSVSRISADSEYVWAIQTNGSIYRLRIVYP